MVDCLTRVSSYKILKKYKKHLLKKIDRSGKLVTFYGAEGKSSNYEDTILPNFRKKEVWD